MVTTHNKVRRKEFKVESKFHIANVMVSNNDQEMLFFICVLFFFYVKYCFPYLCFRPFHNYLLPGQMVPKGNNDNNYLCGYNVLKAEEHLLCSFDNHLCRLGLGLRCHVQRHLAVNKGDPGPHCSSPLPVAHHGGSERQGGTAAERQTTLFWRKADHMLHSVSC